MAINFNRGSLLTSTTYRDTLVLSKAAALLFASLFLYFSAYVPARAADENGVHFGGFKKFEDVQELKDEQRARIESEIKNNVAQLRKLGKLPRLEQENTTTFSFPLKYANISLDNYPEQFYGISNFVDRNPANPNNPIDYNCGNRTYSGHRGTDFFLSPFPWRKMDEHEVSIIAAAPGTIVAKEDGNYDRSCATTVRLK